jgi:hypothetical protein
MKLAPGEWPDLNEIVRAWLFISFLAWFTTIILIAIVQPLKIETGMTLLHECEMKLHHYVSSILSYS